MSAPTQILTRPRGETIVNLDGEFISSAVSAGMRIRTTGIVESRKGAGPTYAQIDNATDWIIPNSASALRTFHVRLDITESNMNAGSDLMNTWIELNVDREWWHVFSGLTRNGTLRISDDGGSTDLDTGPYSFDVP
jgi:hypothetical protein